PTTRSPRGATARSSAMKSASYSRSGPDGASPCSGAASTLVSASALMSWFSASGCGCVSLNRLAFRTREVRIAFGLLVVGQAHAGFHQAVAAIVGGVRAHVDVGDLAAAGGLRAAGPDRS